jgi:hypothetical protein
VKVYFLIFHVILFIQCNSSIHEKLRNDSRHAGETGTTNDKNACTAGKPGLPKEGSQAEARNLRYLGTR